MRELIYAPIHRYSGAWPALKSLKNSGFFLRISSAHFLLFSKMRSCDCWRYLRTSFWSLADILGDLCDEQYLTDPKAKAATEGVLRCGVDGALNPDSDRRGTGIETVPRVEAKARPAIAWGMRSAISLGYRDTHRAGIQRDWRGPTRSRRAC